jgi:hypothetical protein
MGQHRVGGGEGGALLLLLPEDKDRSPGPSPKAVALVEDDHDEGTSLHGNDNAIDNVFVFGQRDYYHDNNKMVMFITFGVGCSWLRASN